MYGRFTALMAFSLLTACGPATASDARPSVPFVASLGPFVETCSVFDLDPSAVSFDGRCEVSYSQDGRMRVIMPGRTMMWSETARQGIWSTGTLDGRPAVRFELNRTAYEYSTLDLKVTLSVRER